MKRIFHVRDAKDLDDAGVTSYHVVSEDNLWTFRASYQGMDHHLTLLVMSDVPLGALYKFVEDYAGDLDCYCAEVHDLVFLSRFAHHDVLVRLARTELEPRNEYTPRFSALRGFLGAP